MDSPNPPGTCAELSQLTSLLAEGSLPPCTGMRLVGHCAAARILRRIGVEPPGGLLSAAITSPGGGSSLRSPSVEAVSCTGSLCRLRGEKVFATNGLDAASLVVYGSVGGEPALFLLQRGAKGIDAEPMQLATYSCSGIARLRLQDAQATLLAKGREARLAVVRGLGENRVLVAALAVGLARRAIMAAAEWARGRGALRHQAVSHRLAAAASWLESAAALTARLAERLDAGEETRLWETSAAKYVAVEAAVNAARAARLTLGGYAYTADDPGRQVRELELHIAALEPAEGTQDIQLEIIARELLGA